jgi:DNA gyrase subunit A
MERNGDVAAVEAVIETDELMLITAAGMMLRTGLSALREIGRATQGVRLIRLDENDKVVAVAKIAPEEDEAGRSEGAPGEVDEGREDGSDNLPGAHFEA